MSNDIVSFLLEHWVLAGAFLFSVVMVIMAEVGESASAKHSITADDLVAAMNDSKAVVVDVRKQDEFVRGHVLGSSNYNLADLLSDKKLQKKCSKKTLILICNNGGISKGATAMALKSGYNDVKFLKDGFSGWQQNNMPVTAT